MTDPDDSAPAEAYWELLARSAPDYLCIVDAEGHYVWVNRVHDELTFDDVIGRSIAEYATPETMESFRRCVARALETGEQQQYDAVSAVGDDEMVHVVTLVPIPGRDDVVVLASRDVTERRNTEIALRESEALGRSVIELYPDLLMLFEPDGTLITANKGLARSLGVEPAQLVGKNVFELMEPEVAAQRRGWADHVMKNRTPRREIDRHRGRVFDTVAYPITAADGTVRGIALMSRDITEATKKEQQLRERQARQWHSEKMQALGTLAAGIAHDFNNLLTSVMANAQLASRPGIPEARRSQLLAAITTASERAAELVKQILAHGGDEDAETTEVDLCTVSAEVISLMRATLAASTEFVAELPAKPALVRGNVARLHQAIMNLCINAGQAMPEGGRVSICVDSTDVADCPELEPGRYVRLRVSDTGQGIAEDVMPRIFEPFYSTKGPDRGSGLGLYVVHGVVTSLGGAVEAETVPGEGTTFTLLLPEVGEPAQAEADGSAMSARQDVPSRRVLLLEDEEAIRQVAVLALESEGHAVKAVARCADALQLIEGGVDEIDIALLDQRVGDGSGLSVAMVLQRALPVDSHRVVLGAHHPGHARSMPRAHHLGHAEALSPERAARLCRPPGPDVS